MTSHPTRFHGRLPWFVRCLFLCFAALALSNCATSASRLSNLRVGMTKPEVIQTLGEPHSSEFRDGVESLLFNLSINRVAEGMFIGVARPLNIGKRFYKVDLVNGRVRAYYQTPKP